MKILPLEQRSDEWFEFRKGKISGTMLGDLYSPRGTRKLGFYELIAERLAIAPDDEDRMDRGLRLEDEAIAMFEKNTGYKVERVGVCQHDKYPDIINSPDGLVKEKGKYTIAVEVKCLSSARHLQAIVENKLPPEFESQVIQYFIVNPDLKYLAMVFYDPRILSAPYFVLPITREELGDKPQKFLQFQLDQLANVNEIIERLAF